jgi:eukaryotic-like serine/threonine-protein kinase
VNNPCVIENPEQLPAQFGPYWLYELIGKGGMAEIFLAKTFTALGTERQCVIKRILPQLNADVAFCEMLIKEAKLCARLSHANIVQTHELGQIDGQFYIAMEYVEGVDLNRLLGLLSRLGTALPLQFALYIIVEALRGLDYAHRLSDSAGTPLGIIHRDVSPTNVLISTEGEVKLCDFGIAKVAFDEPDGEQRMDAYHLKGKVAYMAPEHVAGEPIDRRADLFAAGILLWELLQGRRLYKSKDEDETLRRAKAAEIPPLEDRGFKNREMLEAVAMKALARAPGDRFQTGGEFMRALEDYMHATQATVSQLKFADFLMENFGESLMQQRRERGRHLQELMRLRGEDEEARMSRVRADITSSLTRPAAGVDAEPAAPAETPLAAPPAAEPAKRHRVGPWIAGIAIAVAAAAAVALKLLGVF